MGEKRKLPARASARVESSTKKRKSTPPEPPPKTPTPVPVVVEEVLPKTVVAGKALPTVPEPQPENLPTKEYKSIPESGVLSESLSRSRHRWICEGIFERYWTKPKKVKGHVEEPPNNPAKDTMTKLGPCTITVEPHTFDAMMWAVKDTTPRPPPPPPQPMYRPIIQYGPTNGMLSPQVSQPPPQHRPYVPPPAPSPGLTGVLRPPGHPSPSPAPPTPTTNVRPQGPSPAPVQPPTINNVPNNAYQQPHPQPPRPAPSPVSQVSAPGPSQPNGQINGTAAPAAPPAKSPDPVIQALAERAATDGDLKALMRIVAGGKANPDELRKFQAHIDDLNKLLNIKPKPAPAPASHPPPPPSSGNIYQTQSPNPLYRSSPAPTPSPAPSLQPHVKQEYHMQSPVQSQALRSKGPVAPLKPDISGIVFEFLGPGATGDRFMFPKYSILEHQPSRHEFIASFLIVRKGSSSDSTSYDPKLDYYQPVTIRVWAQSQKNLEALGKVVAPPEEVRKYMDDIMDKATRAEYVLLAMRLPKDPEPTPVVQDISKREQQDDSVLWTTTNGTPPTKQKMVKVAPSEEQQYQNFITTVSAA